MTDTSSFFRIELAENKTIENHKIGIWWNNRTMLVKHRSLTTYFNAMVGFVETVTAAFSAASAHFQNLKIL